MANSNYSTANRLLAYISHGVDLTPEIKNNYINSLIFIGDEGQIYSPINNTYVGIGQTSYTNLLAYTNYLSAQLDALRTMMNSALVSKVYSNYDNYDLYTAEHTEGVNHTGGIIATYALVENYKLENPDWGADYATKELTLRGLGDYDPKTGLAYTSIVVGTKTYKAPTWTEQLISNLVSSGANVFSYTGEDGQVHNGTLPELTTYEGKYYLSAYVNADGTLTTEGAISGKTVDDYEVYDGKEIQPAAVSNVTQNVWETNNAFGSSGITVSLSHGEAKPISDSFGHVYNTYSRNVFTIDDSLTWSYIASAYTYSMGFARQWATSEANRIYNNLIGNNETTYPSLSYDDVAKYVQQQGFHTDVAGYVIASKDEKGNDITVWYDPSSYNHDTYYVFEDYQYVVEDLCFHMYLDPTTYTLSGDTSKLAVDGELHFDVQGLPYIIAKWKDVFGSTVAPQKTWGYLFTYGGTQLSAYGTDASDVIGNTTLLGIVADNDVIYCIEHKNSEYNSTYNTNLADGIQTLKEVAYLLDVLTDGFGSVVRYEAISALTDAAKSLAAAETAAGISTGISDTDGIGNSFAEPFTYNHIDKSNESAVFAQSEIANILAYYWVDGADVYAAVPGSTYAAQYAAYYGDADYVAANFKRINTHTTEPGGRVETSTHKDYYEGGTATAQQVTDASYLDFSGNTDYYTAYSYEGTYSYTRVTDLDHNRLAALISIGLYTIVNENADYQVEEYFRVYAKVVEEIDQQNLGIKMAYTIAGNQEQINTLSNRLDDVEDGVNVLRSIDTTSSTYVTLTTVSNQEGLQVGKNGEFTYAVGDTNIHIGLHFGSTYTYSSAKKDVVFVNTAYMNIGFLGQYDDAGKKVQDPNDDTEYIYKLEAVTDVSYLNSSYEYYTKAQVGYKYLTFEEAKDILTNADDDTPVYTALTTTGGMVVKVHDEGFASYYHVTFQDWADDSTSYYKLTDRLGEGEDLETAHSAIHTDKDSHGLTYTSWVNSYVADTYTLVTNAMTTMEADIINASKSMLDGLDYSYAASSSQMIAYTYQWNGMLGAAARELPTDEIHSNVEVWGESSSTAHYHSFKLVDEETDLMYNGTYTYQYVYTYYVEDAEYKQAYIDGPWANGKHNTEIDEYYKNTFGQSDETKHITYVTNTTSGNATSADHGKGAYWSEYRDAVREAYYLNADLQVYRKDPTAYDLVKLDVKNYGENWADVLTYLQKVELYIETDGDHAGSPVLVASKDGGRTIQSITIVTDATGSTSTILLDSVTSPNNQRNYINDVSGTSISFKGSLDYMGTTDKPIWYAEQHPRTANLGAGLTYETWIKSETHHVTFNEWPYNNDEDPTENPDKLQNASWVKAYSTYTDAGVTEDEFNEYAYNGYMYVANDAAEEFIQYYYKVPRYVEVDPQDLLIGETTYQYGYDKDNNHYDDNDRNGLTYTGTYYYVDHQGTGTDITWGIISDVQRTTYVASVTSDGEVTFVVGHELSTTDKWYVVDENDTTVVYRKSYVQLFKKCEDHETVEQVKYIDTAFKHITAADGGYGENRMHVTTYITHLEDATETNSGLVDAYDARSFIDNMFEWVDLSATVSAATIADAKKADGNVLHTSIYTTEHYNALNPNETTYTFENRIYVKEITD